MMNSEWTSTTEGRDLEVTGFWNLHLSSQKENWILGISRKKTENETGNCYIAVQMPDANCF